MTSPISGVAAPRSDPLSQVWRPLSYIPRQGVGRGQMIITETKPWLWQPFLPLQGLGSMC